MKYRILVLLSLGLFVGPGPVGAQELSGLRVIAHRSNPVSSLSREELSRIFLKKVTRWENGQLVLPVELPENSAVRERFSRAVHRRSVAAVEAYWQQRIFSGREVPPPERTADADVVEYVKANPNAIGYVSADAPVDEVKVLRITESGPPPSSDGEGSR